MENTKALHYIGPNTQPKYTLLPEKGFRCDVCLKFFKTEGNLYSHAHREVYRENLSQEVA